MRIQTENRISYFATNIVSNLSTISKVAIPLILLAGTQVAQAGPIAAAACFAGCQIAMGAPTP